MSDELILPEPIGLQPEWLASPKSRKVCRIGRRGTKTRFALIAAIAGHGPGTDGHRLFPGIAEGVDVVWVAQDYPNLIRVVWQEEIIPRMDHLSWCTINKSSPYTAKINGRGTLHLVSAEAIKGIRGLGKKVGGVIIDEAAWLDLESALQDVILAILLDNGGWLIIMSTTNAGPDGNTAKRVPSYFNIICTQVRAGERSDEWVEFYGTAFDNPVISNAAIEEMIKEYPPNSPKLKQEVYAELLVAGVGLALPDLDAKVHLVPPQSIPAHWPQFGGFDWGYNHPWVFGWYACDEDGNVVCRDTVTGREDQVEEIITTMLASGAPFHQPKFGVYSGHDIFTQKGRAVGFHGPTIAERMLASGIKVVHADIGRVAGLENLRAYVHHDEQTAPRFTMVDTPGNRAALTQMQGIQIDPKNLEDALKMDADLSGYGGDDYYDEKRYALMSRPLRAKRLAVPSVPEDRSLGFDWKTMQPKTRPSSEQEIAKVFEQARSSATHRRYSVPRR